MGGSFGAQAAAPDRLGQAFLGVRSALAASKSRGPVQAPEGPPKHSAIVPGGRGSGSFQPEAQPSPEPGGLATSHRNLGLLGGGRKWWHPAKGTGRSIALLGGRGKGAPSKVGAVHSPGGWGWPRDLQTHDTILTSGFFRAQPPGLWGDKLRLLPWPGSGLQATRAPTGLEVP